MNPGRVIRKRVFAFTLALILTGLSACQVRPLLAVPTNDMPSTYTLQAATLTSTVAPACGYQWASQPLPELSDRIQNFFNEAGLADVIVQAEAYGENCVLSDGSVDRFLPMNTDIHLMMLVEDVDADELLAERLKPALVVIDELPSEWLPGTGEVGFVGPTFTDGENERRLWFPYEQARRALADDLQGADLIQSLSTP